MERCFMNKEDLKQLVKKYHELLGKDAMEYLSERNITKQTIDKFQIGYEKDMIGFQINNQYQGYFRNRIIFPIIDMLGEIVDLVGRSLDGSEPKFKTFLETKDVYFNEPIINQSEEIIFTNSIFDVLSLDQVNLPGICTVSNQLTDNQIVKLTGKRIFLCFGNDESGRRETIRVARNISSVVKDLYIVHLPEGLRDINDFFIHVKNPLEEFVKLLNKAIEENLLPPITPDSNNLVIFQEEYTKRLKGNVVGISTGFEELDQLLMGGLREGLYLLSGDVAIGKSTFLKQLADQVANLSPVIFVSWEMSSFELWVRSISRLSGASSQEILAGKIAFEKVQQANQDYSKIAQNIWTIDANIETTLEEIGTYVNKIVNTINKKPVIIFDYLQRINLKRGLDLSSKDQQLQVVYNLHYWSREFGIPIILATTGNENDLAQDLLASVDVMVSLKVEIQAVRMEIIKNRNGILGQILFSFDRSIGLFSKMSENIN